MLAKIKNEIALLTRGEKYFFLLILPSLFLIMAEYGATRPVSNSLVLTYYSAKIFPYLWLAIVPFNFLIVHLYNHYLVKFGCKKVFLISCFSIGIINALAGIFSAYYHPLVLVQYIWKDVYILLMLKQLWSIIHSSIDKERAKIFYSVLLLMGSLGSLLGNVIPGFFATLLGSEMILTLSFPMYMLAFVFYSISYKHSPVPSCPKAFEKLLLSDQKEVKGAFSLFKGSKPLLFILAIVILMQFSTSIIYYQFNVQLEQAFTLTDLRTQYGAKLQSIVNILSIFFQLGGVVFLSFFGLKRSHIFIPLSFFLNGLLFLFKPFFSVITLFFGYAKAIDFSFFTLIKEMLFVPLNMNEKFRAKAVIDIFAYRTAKGAASILLITFQTLPINLLHSLSVINIGIFIFWGFIIIKTFQKETFAPEVSKSV